MNTVQNTFETAGSIEQPQSLSQENTSVEQEQQVVFSPPPPLPPLIPLDQTTYPLGNIISYDQTQPKAITLTFDASWEYTQTRDLLKILRDYGIKATFFLTGQWVEKHPELVRAIHEDGHDVGNHSYAHRHFTQIAESDIRESVSRTSEAISKIVGYHPNIFRLPYGDSNPRVLEILKDMEYFVIGWSADSVDWREGQTAEEIFSRIQKYHRDGGILLFHIGGFETLNVLPDIIEWYQSQGYQFQTVSQLLKNK